MNSYKIAVGSDLGGVKNIELTWDELKEKLTRTNKQNEKAESSFWRGISKDRAVLKKRCFFGRC